MRKWTAIIATCGLMGVSFGWFWYHEWVKTCKKVSECPGVASNEQEKAFKSEWERQARIRVVKSLLSGYEKGFIGLTQEGLCELKNELCKLTGTEKPVKIYNGRWHKDFLELIKCTEEKSKN